MLISLSILPWGTVVGLRCPLRPLSASAAVGFVIVVRRAELLRVDDLDGPPLARVARHRLHHRRERAAPELLSHVVVRTYAGQLLRREVPVDEPVVLERI